MARTLKRATAALILIAVVAAGGIYASAKPYQQDRILIELGLKSR
jgi:hypothetical protein